MSGARTLVLAVDDGAAQGEVTARLISAAARLGDPVDVLAAGRGCRAAAATAARLAGVDRVLVAGAAQLEDRRAEPLAALIGQLAGAYRTVIAADAAAGAEVLARVAAMRGAAFVGGVRTIVTPTRFERAAFGGTLVETVEVAATLRVLAIHPAAFPPMPARSGTATVVDLGDVPADAGLSAVDDDQPAAAERPDLATARIVIAAGRGIGSEATLQMLVMPLAEKLGAAIGVSRGAIEVAGADADLLVGQSGRSIAPALYIACGISGASQHLAGIRDARVIVAINRDPDAPIMTVADYALAADIAEALPEILRLL